MPIIDRLGKTFVLFAVYLFLASSLPFVSHGFAAAITDEVFLKNEITLEARDSASTDPIDDNRINKALLKLDSLGGGTLRLGPGRFLVDTPLLVFSNIRVVGAGNTEADGTLIYLADNAPTFKNNAGIIRAKDDRKRGVARFVSNVLIEDLIIDGNRDNQKQGIKDQEKKYGFYSEGFKVVIRGVTIRNCMGYGFDPHGDRKSGTKSTQLLIENSIAHGNYKDGFTLDGQSNGVFRNNIAYNNDRHGVNIVSGSSGLLVEANVFYQNRKNGVMIQNDSNLIQVINNKVFENGNDGIALVGSWDILLEKNQIKQNARHGARLFEVNGVILEENSFEHNATRRPNGFEIAFDADAGGENKRVKILSNRLLNPMGKYVFGSSERNSTMAGNQVAR